MRETLRPNPSDETAPLPGWFNPLLGELDGLAESDVRPGVLPVPPREGEPNNWHSQPARPSAVLILLQEGANGAGPQVLLQRRAAGLRHHAGEIAFPGGMMDSTDSGAAQCALREASEELGVRRESVQVVAQLPKLWIPVSNFAVTPVLGWWHSPHDVRPMGETEVASALHVPLSTLANPAIRVRVKFPSGHFGPGFQTDVGLVWGFTGGVLAWLLELGGWAQEWDTSRLVELPARPRPNPV
ncbi:NUDIX hydrolase [Natronoglycomyces albus]|uniref:CoA pyrophosphatase n=1 Tax=Natronoglycomyces albus TaxID=2811108 RepID=A0A895XMG2_9ACTN|nr:CoA pyrophosphatase [Natronoglycomyces albus]QSB04952.1 CoA pyrophosphatase [Natronoglycomyces albus]